MVGPVFWREIGHAGKQRRRFWMRTLFVLVVALLLWIVASRTQTAVTFSVPTPLGPQTITRFQGIRQQAAIGQRQYELYRVLMFATIIFFGPALSAGRIAAEKANKSLVLVLTTPLAGWRVVFDKVLVSFCEQAEVLLAGLPVLIMIGWFGGVRLEQVVFDSTFAISLAFAISAISLLISLAMKRPIEAIFTAYLVPLSLLAIPYLQKNPTNWSFADAFNMLPQADDSASLVFAIACCLASGLCAVTITVWNLKSWTLGESTWRFRWPFVRRRLTANNRSSTSKSTQASVRRWSWFSVAKEERLLDESPLIWRELIARRSSRFERVIMVVLVALSLFLLVNLCLMESLQQPKGRIGFPLAFFLVVGTWLYLALFAFPIMAAFGASAWSDERRLHVSDDLFMAEINARQLSYAKLARLVRWTLWFSVPTLMTSIMAMLMTDKSERWYLHIAAALHMVASILGFGLLGIVIAQRTIYSLRAMLWSLGLALFFGFGTTMILFAMGGPPNNSLNCFMMMVWAPCLSPIVVLARQDNSEFDYAELMVADCHLTIVVILFLLALRPKFLPGLSSKERNPSDPSAAGTPHH